MVVCVSCNFRQYAIKDNIAKVKVNREIGQLNAKHEIELYSC